MCWINAMLLTLSQNGGQQIVESSELCILDGQNPLRLPMSEQTLDVEDPAPSGILNLDLDGLLLRLAVEGPAPMG